MLNKQFELTSTHEVESKYHDRSIDLLPIAIFKPTLAGNSMRVDNIQFILCQ